MQSPSSSSSSSSSSSPTSSSSSSSSLSYHAVSIAHSSRHQHQHQHQHRHHNHNHNHNHNHYRNHNHRATRPPAVNMLLNYLLTTLNAPYPATDPILDAGPSIANPAILSSRPHDVLRLARAKLHAWPYRDVPVCWRRVVIEAVLWVCVGVLRGRVGEMDNEMDVDMGIEVEKEKEMDGFGGVPVRWDWVAELMAVLDEGVVVSGAPGREEVVGRVVEGLEGVLGLRGENGGKEEEEEEEEVDGRVHVDGDDSVHGRKRKRKRRKVSNASDEHVSGIENSCTTPAFSKEHLRAYRTDSHRPDYTINSRFYPQSLNPLPSTFSCASSSSTSSPSTTIPIKHPIPCCDAPSLAAFEAHLRGVARGALKTDQDDSVNSHMRNTATVANELDLPTPLVLTSTLAHWPAICDPNRSWNSPAYLLSRALGGRRLVPVEIGRSYVDDGWGQKIVPFGEFMGMLLRDDDDDGMAAEGSGRGASGESDGACDGTGGMVGDRHCSDDQSAKERQHETSKSNKESENVNEHRLRTREKQNRRPKWYLAQHDLFTQMPGLRADIAIPEYCYLSSTPTPPATPSASPMSSASSSSSPPPPIHVNAWLGPAGTISPLHTDPHHNILAQVVGRKYVRLYAPRDTKRVYPRCGSGSGGKKQKLKTKKRKASSSSSSQNDGNDSTSTSRSFITDDRTNNQEKNNSDSEVSEVEAVTPHQSANTSYVDVGDVLEWGRSDDDDDDNNINNDDDNDGDRGNSRDNNTKKYTRHQQALDNIRTKYPLFLDAPYFETILEPGECLFIPRSWWHYVRSLSVSFSVSFWWD